MQFIKYFSVLACVLLFAGLSETHAMNIYRVGEEITGVTYNEVWEKWFEKKFSIWVGVGSDKEEYIFFKGETALGQATVSLKYTQDIKNKLKEVVSKAIEWAEVAKKNKADASKTLTCFGYDKHGVCKKAGVAMYKNQLGLSFFSSRGGTQTDLVIIIIDRKNQFTKTDIYIDLPSMKKLLANIDKIDFQLEKARKTAKDQDLFQ